MTNTIPAVFFSSYSLTEDEYETLRKLRDQLGFVNMLLAGVPDRGVLHINSDQLYAFNNQLESNVGDMLKDIEARTEASRGLMRWVDWSLMLRLISGEHPGSPDVLRRVTERLEASVKLEPNMTAIYESWVAAITNFGSVPLNDLLDRACPAHVAYAASAAPASTPAVAPENKPRAASRKRENLIPAA